MADIENDHEFMRALPKHDPERALEQILHEHGPMVMGVCRRVLEDQHLAEDAFQATFIVLVRKHRSLILRKSLGAWLHGVALRTAQKAKAMENRRRATGELSKTELPSQERDPAEEAAWTELRSLVDSEIQRLPEKLRSVVVLCLLESATHKQAAQRLGVPFATVSARMLRAKEQLRGRLARRGVAISSAGLTAALVSRAASAAVSPGLVSATARLAILTLAGEAAAVDVTAVMLADAVIKAMQHVKSLIVGVSAIAVLCVGIGAAAIVGSGAIGISQPMQQANLATDISESDPFLEADRAVMHLGEQAFRHLYPRRVAYLPGRNQLVTISSWGHGSGGVFLWDTVTGRKSRTLFTASNLAEQPGKLAVSPTGNLFAVGFRGSVRVWDAETGQLMQVLTPTENWVTALEFTPNGRELITGAWDGKVHVYNMDDFSLRRELVVPLTQDRFDRERKPSLGAVAASPDGRRIATGEDSGAIHVFDVDSGELVTSIDSADRDQSKHGIHDLAFSPNGSELLSSGYRWARREKSQFVMDLEKVVENPRLLEVRRWDAATGELIDDLVDGDVFGIGAAAFAPDGASIATADWDAVRSWQIGNGRPQFTIPVRFGSNPDVAYSPDGSTIAVPTSQGITFWDAKTGERRWHNRPPNYASIRNVAWSRDGSQLAICYGFGDFDDCHVETWDAETGRMKHRLPMAASGEAYISTPDALDAAFSRDGRILVAVGNYILAGWSSQRGVIKSWDAVRGRELRTIAVDWPIRAMALPEDASVVAVGLSNPIGAEIQVFDLATGTLVGRAASETFDREVDGEINGFDYIRAMRMQPGSTKVFVACASGYCFQWDYKTPRENIGVFAGADTERDGGAIMSAAFSPDCRQLITSGRNRIWLWDTEQGALQHVETLPLENRFLELAISQDGRKLVAAEGRFNEPLDNAVRIWELPSLKSFLTLHPPDGRATSFAFSPDNSKVLTGLDSGTAVIWDVQP
jgi:RNA polymerase sigma factor (sigma-70 family)